MVTATQGQAKGQTIESLKTALAEIKAKLPAPTNDVSIKDALASIKDTFPVTQQDAMTSAVLKMAATMHILALTAEDYYKNLSKPAKYMYPAAKSWGEGIEYTSGNWKKKV